MIAITHNGSGIAEGGALHHQRLFNKLKFKICTQIQKSTTPPLTQIMC